MSNRFTPVKRKRDRAVDITGQVFGQLTAVERIGTRGRRPLWLCRCTCGNITSRRRTDLSRAQNATCDKCIEVRRSTRRKRRPAQTVQMEIPFTRVGAGLRALYRDYRLRARRRNVAFDLSESLFEDLVSQRCFYCGALPFQSRHRNRYPYVYTGLDRIDNAMGYQVGNVHPCCWDCNRAKGTRSESEFLAWVERTYKNLFGERG